MRAKREKSKASGFWQKHVTSWQKSGQKQAVYCRKHGLKQYQFGYWVRKQASPGNTKPEKFVEVRQEQDQGASSMTCQISMPGGVVVRLTASCGDLGSILRSVRESAC